MIEFGCHTWAFNDLTLSEALGTIARLGFRYVDLGSGPGLNSARAATNPRKTANEITEDLDFFNLKISDLYLMLPRISLDDDERRAKDIEIFQALMPFAQALKTPGITVSPGLAHAPEDTAAFARTTEALRALVAAGEKVKIPVSIEPHVDSMAATPEAALKLIDAVPGLGITLDWAQMIYQNIKHSEIIRLLPHVRHVQIRSATRTRLQTPFEKGRIDLPRMLGALLDAEYDGVITVETTLLSGRYGIQPVNAAREVTNIRDALRDTRNTLLKSTAT
ncbi:MAG: sugar phosphate isomerase/epimerase [Chloroflexi bacterium]|nr:sugar phosphate isomerase/epimerase [Chloroflexota bacterium]